MQIMFVLVEIYMGVNLETSNCFSLMLSSTSFQLHTLFLTASLFSLIEHTTPRDITI